MKTGSVTAWLIVAGVLAYGPITFLMAIWKLLGGGAGWESLFCGGAALICSVCAWVCLVAIGR